MSFILISPDQIHSPKRVMFLYLTCLSLLHNFSWKILPIQLWGVSITKKDKLVILKSNLAQNALKWQRFGFQLPNYLVLELTEKHFSCSKQIAWEAMGIWHRLNFFWAKMGTDNGFHLTFEKKCLQRRKSFTHTMNFDKSSILCTVSTYHGW